jgi:hypothetical protein
VRFLLRDADKDVDAEEIEALMEKTSVDAKKKVPKGKEQAKLTSRQMLLKLLLHDFVRDTKPGALIPPLSAKSATLVCARGGRSSGESAAWSARACSTRRRADVSGSLLTCVCACVACAAEDMGRIIEEGCGVVLTR